MAHPAFGNGFSRANGASSTSPDANTALDSDLATMTKRFEQLNAYNKERDRFMEELFARFLYMHEQNHLLFNKRKHEEGQIVAWHAQRQQYDQYIKNMQRAMNQNPFVVLLIDGDGMVFIDDFVRGGEEGGRRAATQLLAAVQEYNGNDLQEFSMQAQIICRVYANVRGLADVLVRTGAIGEAETFNKFVRGFTRGQALFDFVDVGPGKDRADEKIIDSFKIYSQDVHCRRLLFGCSHDNGYARTLEKYSHQHEILEKVVLMEGVPFEKELVSLPYKTKKFPGIFRNSKLNVWGPFILQQLSKPPVSPTATAKPVQFPGHVKPTESLHAPVRTRSDALAESPLPVKSTLHLSRTPSSSTIASDGCAAPKPAPLLSSWAAKAAAPAPPVDITRHKAPKRDEGISRNRAGQRVDPPSKDYDKMEVDRVKKLKMCNVHFLRQECPFVHNCTHVHAYNPTQDELRTLRLVARMAPCQNGSGCQDARCIYGHRCPAPTAKFGHIKGTKSCIFGESCKFPAELHDTDTTVVKTLVVR